MSSVGYGDSISMPLGLIYNQSPTNDNEPLPKKINDNWPIVLELAGWTTFILFGQFVFALFQVNLLDFLSSLDVHPDNQYL